jgi:hypothetical protein
LPLREQQQKPHQSKEATNGDGYSMDIIRVVQNGVEFYTRVCDGESGMSQSGIGRLVGEHHHQIGRIATYLENFENTEIPEKPKRTKGRPPKQRSETFYEDFLKDGDPLAHKWLSKQLEPFIRSVPTLAQSGTLDGKDLGNIKIYRHDFCGAVIRHFAYRGNETAQYSLDKFSDRGILDWIHEITGWQPEPKTIKPQTRARELGINPRYVCSVFDRHIFYNDLFNKELTAPMYRVYLYQNNAGA